MIGIIFLGMFIAVLLFMLVLLFIPNDTQDSTLESDIY